MIEQKENGLNNLIVEEKLKPEETYRFVNNAIKDGAIKLIGLILIKYYLQCFCFQGKEVLKNKR